MLIDQQISQTVDADISGLSEQYAQGGIRRLVQSVERRTQRPGADLYLVTTAAGEPIAGNIASLPPGVLERPGVVETTYEPAGAAGKQHRAMARIFALPGGFRLLVGHDLEEGDSLRQILGQALLTSLFWLVVIGTLGGLWVARRVLHRVDSHQRQRAERLSPATLRAGCRSPAPATNSTGWCRTSTPCWTASAISWPD